MLKCENHYFRIREDYFCGLLDCAFTQTKQTTFLYRQKDMSHTHPTSKRIVNFSHSLHIF
jgi:hypothetical protein